MNTIDESVSERRTPPVFGSGTFGTTWRPQLVLDVSDLKRAVAFYKVLFDDAPCAESPGEARFEPSEPPVALVLRERAGARARDGHVGVQLKYTERIQAYKARLEGAGYPVKLEEQETACCFSTANKVWVTDPDENLWEVYVLLGQNTSEVRCGPSCACESAGCS
jgi:catechol 2,3-dioxygenase-like lactoylglutathione lyase family enzyme